MDTRVLLTVLTQVLSARLLERRLALVTVWEEELALTASALATMDSRELIVE